MTDEQFQELISAISSRDEVWVTSAIAVLSALLGFGAALWAESIRRNRARKDDRVAERLAVARQAAGWAYRISSNPPRSIPVVAARFSDESAEVLVRLSGLEDNDEDLVGGWFLRRISMLIDVPVGLTRWSDDDQRRRTDVAVEVSKGLQAWARGERPEREFGARRDARWIRYGGFDVERDESAIRTWAR